MTWIDREVLARLGHECRKNDYGEYLLSLSCARFGRRLNVRVPSSPEGGGDNRLTSKTHFRMDTRPSDKLPPLRGEALRGQMWGTGTERHALRSPRIAEFASQIS